MAARITLKLALEQIEALRHNLNLVETERDSLKAEVVKLRSPAPTRTSTFVRRGPSAEQQAAHEAYVAALMRAKDLAIRSGRSVSVSRRED